MNDKKRTALGKDRLLSKRKLPKLPPKRKAAKPQATGTGNGATGTQKPRPVSEILPSLKKNRQRKPKPSDILDPEPPTFYYVGRGQYVVRNYRGHRPINERNVINRLEGLSKKTLKKMGYDNVNWIPHIQDNFYAPIEGRFAGYPEGYYPDLYEQAILVTSEAMMIEPTRGGNMAYRDFTDRLLREQAKYIHAWRKNAIEERLLGIERLRAGNWPNWRPAQAVALIGEPNDGKTLALLMDVRIIGGERSIKGNPAQSYAGGTTFNEDTSEREFHALDDDFDDVDTRAKNRLREAIKKSVADPDTRIHGKGKKAEMLKLYRRTEIAINSKNIDVMPTLTGGAGDKFIILKTYPAVDPNDGSRETWDKREADLVASLSDYMGWLLYEFEVPPECRDPRGRYGCASYKNPDIMATINYSANEGRLLELVQEWLTASSSERFIGKSSQLHATLFPDCGGIGPREAIGRDVSAFGRLLSSAAECFPKQICNWGRIIHGEPDIYEVVLIDGAFSKDKAAVKRAWNEMEEARIARNQPTGG